MRSFLPETDAALANWATTFSTGISTNPVLLGLTQAQADAYDALRVEFIGLYARAIDPATRTTPNILAKNAARELVKAKSRELAKIIQANPQVTDSQRATLGLNVRKHRTPEPVPSVRPDVDVVSVVGRTVSIRIHDSATTNTRAKPAGVKAAWVYSFVGATYPTDPALWHFHGSATRSNFEIEFPGDVAPGTLVWFCAAWTNSKQQAGPASVPISTNLQGGGMNAPAKLKMAA